jgi:pantoate--beta-alanine ligase
MAALCRDVQRPLGLVPTMGALHDGHLSLTRRARADSATMAVSIFVNPTQFGAGEDFNSYPRSFERDLELLAEQGTDLVFAPPPEEVYPDGFDTWIEPGSVAEGQEGEARPGHFKGVATVVAKLFNMVKPHAALFGEKDFQQCVVIKRMVKDLNFDLEILAMPTIRESDGLAMSSRNARLSSAQRQTSLRIASALNKAHQLVGQGERRAATILQVVHDLIGGQDDTRLEYASLCDPETLEEVDEVTRPSLLAIAAWVGDVRLIDNRLIG